MKRRTFLQLAPFAVIGLTACGKSDSAEATNKSLSSASSSSGSSSMETNQIIDDMDEDYEESGLTLEEARYYSKTYNCAYFIRRADDGMFYPVAVPLVAIERSKNTRQTVFSWIPSATKIRIYGFFPVLSFGGRRTRLYL